MKEYEMTQENLVELIKAAQPVPLIAIHCGMPPSPQQNANDAWTRLGKKLGFKPMTVKPVKGKGDRFFTAEPV